jgi:hypothetical protein
MQRARSFQSMLVRSKLAVALALGLAACGGKDGAGIGGTLSGLAAGQVVALSDNNTDALTLEANGTFQFPTDLASGAPYSVAVVGQPSGQVCEVANGAGTVDSSGDAVTNVAVACVTTSSLGGTVSGLAAGTAVTLSNGTVLLPVTTNGAFAFPGVLVAGTNYEVTVATQPLGQTCAVVNGTGAITAASVNAVGVTCS